MSNGDEILDSWEEIDETGLKNKLKQLQAGRKEQEINEKLQDEIPQNINTTTDKKQMKLLRRNTEQEDNTLPTTNNTTSPLDDIASSFEPVMMVLHKPNDEYQSANYAQPISSQTVKILRRPTQSSEPRNNGVRPRQPIKTLQQREQEYAEARLRILGSAKNPEDDTPGANNNIGSSNTPTTIGSMNKINVSKIQPSGGIIPTPINNPIVYLQQPTPPQKLQQQQPQFFYQQNHHAATAFFNRPSINSSIAQQGWSPIVGGSVSSTVIRQQQQQQDSILRLPRGPDSSGGFQMRR